MTSRILNSFAVTLLQFSGGKIRKFNGIAKCKPSLDLVFFDCQENLPVPGVSSPPNTVPAWNEDKEYEDLQSAFAFAEQHLHDDGCLIVFHSFSAISKGNIIGLCETYQMLKKKEWLGMNRLHLTSALDVTTTVSSVLLFIISVLFNNGNSLACY